jgi:Tfp pilus assembly protein PilF
MRHLFLWLVCSLSFLGLAATSEAYISGAGGQSDTEGSNAASAAISPEQKSADPTITVTGKVPPIERPLPKLPPTEFTDCMKEGGGLSFCAFKLDMERHIVIERCLNRDGHEKPPMAIQACTESLDHNILQGGQRSFLLVNRADAYFADGDKQRALEDYNRAIKVAPHKAAIYYNRGIFYAAQSDAAAALRDYNAALGIDPKLVPALHARAKLNMTQSNLSSAVADYSEAIHLQPTTAALWSERGFVYLLQRDYQHAVKDEAEAIRLDPKLATAYFFRGSAYGGLGDAPHARTDMESAVGLEPSLQRYVTSTDRSSADAHPH